MQGTSVVTQMCEAVNLVEGSYMLNKISMNNRRIIMSAKMLNVYQQDADNTSKGDEEVNEHTSQKSDALMEYDDKAIYELGYN